MQRPKQPAEIELLAPARDASIALDAIVCGADAVYIGGPTHGARAAAGNSIADIARVAEYAHRFNARVYVTLNTIIYQDELPAVERIVGELYRAGVDALIVQDMGLLRLDLPPIALHASTQCDIRTPAKARFLEEAGFSQLVLPREMTLDEIRAVREAVSVPLEGFVHGALCVSYSGDCQASCATTGRSANRGECAQICRHSFDLLDRSGNILVANRHLLSLRDLNRSADIAAMIEAGISSFKIEGRLKDSVYVRNTVAAYRRAIDSVIEASDGRYIRSSAGRSDVGFIPDTAKSFNRGFTTYFLQPEPAADGIASIATPKMRGPEVATVIASRGNRLTVKATESLNNGDGLVYFDRNGEFKGFRLNRVEGNTLYLASPVAIDRGTTLYRNLDRVFETEISRARPVRRIPVDIDLRLADPDTIVITLSDTRGNRVTATAGIEPQPARTPQQEARRRVLTKLGDTIYEAAGVTDTLGDIFVAASTLTELRRKAVDLLDTAQRARYMPQLRRPENPDAKFPAESLDYHDNVANSAARRFYNDHGVTEIAPALETVSRSAIAPGTRVMTTRYCLRRELGHCMLDEQRQPRWPAGDLVLRSGPMRFDVHFDCANCRMSLLTT